MDKRSPIYANFRITHFTHRSTPSFHSFHSAFHIPQFRILPTATSVHTSEFAAALARRKLVHQEPTLAVVGNILNKNRTKKHINF